MCWYETHRPHIVIHVDAGGDHARTVVCTLLSDLDDYDQPLAGGALVKAALVASGLLTVRGTNVPPLATQLHTLFGENADGAGLEVATWSHLPVGSGACCRPRPAHLTPPDLSPHVTAPCRTGN